MRRTPGAGLPELGAKPYKYTSRTPRHRGGKRMVLIGPGPGRALPGVFPNTADAGLVQAYGFPNTAGEGMSVTGSRCSGLDA